MVLRAGYKDISQKEQFNKIYIKQNIKQKIKIKQYRKNDYIKGLVKVGGRVKNCRSSTALALLNLDSTFLKYGLVVHYQIHQKLTMQEGISMLVGLTGLLTPPLGGLSPNGDARSLTGVPHKGVEFPLRVPIDSIDPRAL